EVSIKRSLGSICSKRSARALSPKSGEQHDQMAPKLFTAKKIATVSILLFSTPTTRSPFRIPLSIRNCCILLTLLSSSCQVISLYASYSEQNFMAMLFASKDLKICSAYESSIPSNHLTPIKSFSLAFQDKTLLYVPE